MINITKTIEPKSDQLNADSLIGRNLTITVTGVSAGVGDQPVSIHYEGDNGKPFKPCKSMRRVLVQCWGGDGTKYVGRSMTLYRDDSVKFGGVDVGGIRISHLSDIKGKITMALTASRSQRKPYTILPLVCRSKEDIIAEGKAAADKKAWFATLSESEAAIARANSKEINAVKEPEIVVEAEAETEINNVEEL